MASPHNRKEKNNEKSGYTDDSKDIPMEIDDYDFIHGPDADSDFGSDYDTAVDDDFPPARSDPFQDPSSLTSLSSNGTSGASAHALALNSERSTPTRQNTFNGLSSASTQAARDMALRLSEPSTSRSNTRPPPTYADVVLDVSSTTRRTGPMCIICNVRPAFNNGYRSFPTCGNRCAQMLKDATRNGGSSRHPFSDPSHGQTQQDNPYRSSRSQGPIKMCDVCHLRPRYQKGGKVYPTCGLTCAARLHPPGSVPKCDYCKERPKVVLNGKIFPHCGRTCRDKAKGAAVAALNSATCTTCLICWKTQRIGEHDDFCSDSCKTIADRRAPFLIEIPQGHASFKKVSEFYAREWKDTKRPCPVVKRIFMLQVKPTFVDNYEKYRSRISVVPGGMKKGNEARHWLGVTRDCGFGDAGSMEPCSSPRCLLCSITRSSVSQTNFPKGIITTEYLDRAVERSSKAQKSASKVVLLTQVLLGNETELTVQELIPPLPPRGCDSIRLVEYRTFRGKSDYHGEHIVFEAEAVRPLYLISFE